MKEASWDQINHFVNVLAKKNADIFQWLTENWDLIKILMGVPNPRLIDQKRLKAFLAEYMLLPINPYAAQIVKPAWDYPPDFKMKPWDRQLTILNDIYPGYSAEGLQEMAEGWLADEAVWQETYTCRLYGTEKTLYDGLLVYLLPGRVAQYKLNANLWIDVKEGRQGEGVWGRLCEEALFPHFVEKSRYNAFENWRQGEMGSNRFLPIHSVSTWLQEQETQIKGDFACRPFSFGRAMAGYSVLASRWEIENVRNGISTPSWLNGQGLLTHPERMPKYGCLHLDNGGDQHHRFEGLREFLDAPYFFRDDDRLNFAADRVAPADGRCGSGFVRR